MTLRLTISSTAIACVALTTALYATTLPESYPLSEAEPTTPNPTDPALQNWMDEHVDRSSAFDLQGKEFTEFVAKQDPITQHYLLLANANHKDDVATAKKVIASFEKQLTADAKKPSQNVEANPLLPFLYLEMLRSEDLSPENAAIAISGILKDGAGSCAQKQSIYEDLTRDNLAGLSDDALKEILQRVDGFRSQNFRKSALRRFVGSLPEDREAAVSDKVWDMAQAYPVLVSQSNWLKKIAADQKSDPNATTFKVFADARQAARKRRCSTAKGLVISGLAKVRNPASMPDALSAAKAVGNCYRQRSAAQRRDFWKKIESPLEQAYGFSGWAEARLSLGYLHWAVDDFDNAKTIFGDVVERAAQVKNGDVESKAIYALGRIAENEGNYDKAIEYYKTYISRFVTGEHLENALMALVLLHIDKLQWDEALGPLEGLIQAQSQIDVDQRSVGALSFALFWAGRIYLEKGQKDHAEEMWRRVASEFYSTYYGAIGHYMLEKISGHKLALEPSRSGSFSMDKLLQDFSKDDRQHVHRIETLLSLGLKGEAICELDELNMANSKPEKLLTKALIYYSAGEWLNAIKAYDALPRSFRNSLPVGFERILFPRRYVDKIHEYAAKANIDPDLVMAVIRQESVFNPSARSPVGAMGLMQLMPKTAILESRHLESSYLSASDRHLLRQRVQQSRNLLVPETNLALGIHHLRSLLTKYVSPVFVLSAYNASPAAAQKWQESLPTKDILAFIERIPYRETRAYVKLVLRNYFYYKRWYEGPNERLSHLETVTSPLIAMVKPDAQKAPEAKPNH